VQHNSVRETHVLRSWTFITTYAPPVMYPDLIHAVHSGLCGYQDLDTHRHTAIMRGMTCTALGWGLRWNMPLESCVLLEVCSQWPRPPHHWAVASLPEG
jgi:hypothetical protein